MIYIYKYIKFVPGIIWGGGCDEFDNTQLFMFAYYK